MEGRMGSYHTWQKQQKLEVYNTATMPSKNTNLQDFQVQKAKANTMLTLWKSQGIIIEHPNGWKLKKISKKKQFFKKTTHTMFKFKFPITEEQPVLTQLYNFT